MEVTVVRLSRPLLLGSGRYKDDYTYQLIYGYIIKQPIQEVKLNRVDEYVGYLAALHLFFNGSGKDFSISWDARGVPDWEDKKGKVHLKYDAWMKKICTNSINKLGLSHYLIPMNLDEEQCSQYVNKDDLIVDEDFYWELYEYLPEDSEFEQPLWKEEDLPF